ncbi:MAG: hypothetical protein JO339_40815 [Alphaproteobacteria bacterium]|nr:hypothetical protein [Alphaproteobacteria bacterium]
MPGRSGLANRLSLAVVGLVFALAVAAGIVQRLPYIGTLTEGHHQWLMAEYAKFVEYWERDGIFADRFLTLESPRSIETTTLESRIVYTSFIPGGVVQVWLLHRLLPGVPLVTLISGYGIALQALVALIYGLLVWRMMRPEDRAGPALFFVFAAMLTYLFHPAPYYFHPMVPFAYQAALVPIALGTFLEYLMRAKGRRSLWWVQTLILGWLAACDWSFIPFCLGLTLFRLVSPLPGAARPYARASLLRMLLSIWLLPSLVCAAYLADLYFSGLLEDLVSRALLRTGVAKDVAGVLPMSFWSVYKRVFVETLGNTQVWLHLAALASLYYLVRDRRDPVAVVCCLSLLTPYLYVVLLPNDVSTHDFQSMKFFVPLSLVAFGVMPYRLIWSLHGWARALAFGAMVFLWAFYMIHFRTDWEAWYQPAPPATQALAEWLRAHTTFDEVFLSDSVEIADNPPVPVAISYKRVWRFATPRALKDFAAGLPAGARLRFVSKADYAICFAPADTTALPDGLKIYRIEAPSVRQLDCLAASWKGRG